MEINKVLLVDDDPNIRKLAKMSLERVGRWQVVVASSGKEALAMITSESPDVILLDVMMPDWDGRMTLVQLKSVPKVAQVPVILMTAKVPMDEMNEFLSLGAIGVIIKPFDPMMLPKEIKELVSTTNK
jgi:CheY-like chemotaxis protein